VKNDENEKMSFNNPYKGMDLGWGKTHQQPPN
jgi:hypothetical protein